MTFLESIDGEISFFRSLTRARPIGIHRHFNIIAIRNAIYRDTNHKVNIDDLWNKLADCYNLDALEAIDLEAEGYESPSNTTFPDQFQLPYDEFIDSLIAERRLRTSPSPPSSPVAPTAPLPTRSGKKRGRTKLSMAGLVGGESDSSALTQESGDEADGDGDAGGAGSPRASSVVTGTDPGTDHVDDEDADMPEPSAPSTRGRGKYAKKGAGARGRGGTRGAAAESTSAVGRPPKKRKR